MSVLEEFYLKAEWERTNNNLERLSYEVAASDLRSHWPEGRRVAIKKGKDGPILVAEHICSERISLSYCMYGEIPWWYEGTPTKALVKAIMALPDYYQQALIEPDMSLDEIHQAQEMIDGR